MRVGVITFPGTLDDRDAARAVVAGGSEAVLLWHADADLKTLMQLFCLADFLMVIICAAVQFLALRQSCS